MKIFEVIYLWIQNFHPLQVYVQPSSERKPEEGPW
jgi:hypothetical protein